MPEPVRGHQRYVPGLDGLRALAVLAVIAYHLNLPLAPGGLLGVGVFFTLSGYLITDLLLGHWRRVGNLGLRDFWLRRARRLLPALFVMLAAVSVWVAVVDPGQLVAFRSQVLAATFYISNWSAIVQHGSYFARFAAPLPLDHLWSLAIEEQFYLVWPWLLWLGLWAARRSRLAWITLAAAAASAFAMLLLYHPGFDPTRVYEGTDTRAFGLFVGAALAMAWPSRNLRPDVRPAARNLLDIIGVAGLVGILLLVWRTGTYSPFLYRGGLGLLSIATAAVVATVVHPATRLGRLLGWGPLVWVGVRSYGIYLWHWPIITLTSPAGGDVDWTRRAAQVAATFAIAALSWRYVEEPIRRGSLGRLWRQVRSGAFPLTSLGRRLLAAGTALTVVTLASLGLAGLLPSASSGPLASAGVPAAEPLSPPVNPEPSADRSLSSSPSPAHIQPTHATRTSCSSVVYMGDSTSDGEISPDSLPNRADRLPAQFADVGVKRTNLQVSGARSILETLPGQANAATVAQQLVSHHFRGCWVLALGTNDTGNVYEGSSLSRAARIARMMSIIGHQPVLWVDTVSLRDYGPYSESEMRAWNKDLLAACTRYRFMRVFDWAAVVKRLWFVSDQVHYTSLGSAQRARLTARALVAAFPADGSPSANCVVR